MNTFHALTAVKDLTLFSVFFTKIMPSRVQVSISLPARFPGDLPADPRHVLVYEDPRTLQFAPVSHDRTLGVTVLWLVNEAMTSRGVALSSPVRPTLWERTMSWASIFTPSFVAASSRTTASVSSPAFSGIPRILMMFRREYCSSSSHFSSSSLTLVFSALISESFLAISKSTLPVIVLASPRSSCARCSVVSGAVTSSEVIATSSASISIVDWRIGRPRAAGEIRSVFSGRQRPARV